MLNIALMQVLWLTFAPISTDAAAVFANGNVDNIDLISIIYLLLAILMAVPAAWCTEKFGLKWGAGIGVLLLNVFGALRAFAPNYGWLVVFSVLCAVGQPFVINAISKVSSNWFPEKEEVLASGLMSMAIFVGMLIAMFLPNLILTPYRSAGSLKEGIYFILKIQSILSIITLTLFFLLAKDKPKVPPNPIAAAKKLTMTVGFKSIFKNRDFLLLMCCFFIGGGAFNAIITKIDIIFRDRALGMDPSVVASVMGVVIMVGGMLGSVIIATLSDSLHRRKPFLILSVVFNVPLILLMQYASNIWIIGICCFLFGFFLVSAQPVGFIYAVEKTHPIPEVTSNSILMMCGQITGIIFVLIFNMKLLALLFGVSLILSLFLKEIDRKKVSSSLKDKTMIPPRVFSE
jgi:MFS family permease